MLCLFYNFLAALYWPTIYQKLEILSMRWGFHNNIILQKLRLSRGWLSRTKPITNSKSKSSPTSAKKGKSKRSLSSTNKTNSSTVCLNLSGKSSSSSPMAGSSGLCLSSRTCRRTLLCYWLKLSPTEFSTRERSWSELTSTTTASWFWRKAKSVSCTGSTTLNWMALWLKKYTNRKWRLWQIKDRKWWKTFRSCWLSSFCLLGRLSVTTWMQSRTLTSQKSNTVTFWKWSRRTMWMQSSTLVFCMSKDQKKRNGHNLSAIDVQTLPHQFHILNKCLTVLCKIKMQWRKDLFSIIISLNVQGCIIFHGKLL